MKKIEYLFTGNFEFSGQMFHKVKGQVEEVTDAEAQQLIQDKCAVLYVEKPKKVKYYDNKNK